MMIVKYVCLFIHVLKCVAINDDDNKGFVVSIFKTKNVNKMSFQCFSYKYYSIAIKIFIFK
jgi:hypothetical protein